MSSYTYRLSPVSAGYSARCVELDAEAEGPTQDAAVEALRQALLDRLTSTDAVAPPSTAPRVSIELREATAPPASRQGPGEP